MYCVLCSLYVYHPLPPQKKTLLTRATIVMRLACHQTPYDITRATIVMRLACHQTPYDITDKNNNASFKDVDIYYH